MKVAALAALSVLIALPAGAVQRHRQPAPPAVTCDNDGRCTTPSAGTRTQGQERIETASQYTTAATPRRGHAIDANGNKAVGVVISIRTGAKARVGISYAARFQAYIDDLENNYGARVLFMSGQVTADFTHFDFAQHPFELLTKPFRPEGLLRAVRSALDRPIPRRTAPTGNSGEGPMVTSSLK